MIQFILDYPYLLLGVWVTWKFQHVILPKSKLHADNLIETQERAMMDDYKQLKEQYPKHDVRLQQGEDGDVRWYAIVVTSFKNALEAVFVPYKPNK